MSDNTSIEWSDATWSPLLGCDRVSPGCDNCYAITQAHIRAANPHPRVAAAFADLTKRTEQGIDWTGQINQLPDRLTQPLEWRKPRRVFVNSLSDLFHDKVEVDFIAQVFAVMSLATQHDFQLLTKRHGRMRSLLNNRDFVALVDEHRERIRPGRGDFFWPLPNLWLGVSAEDQKRADLRIPALLGTPAAVRWISAEPLLGPVDLSRWLVPEMTVCQTDGQPETMRALAELGRTVARRQGWAGLDWVVVGGESGPGARPMHPQWARDLRDQCGAAGVPYLFKQFGAWVPESAWLHPATAPAAFLNVDGTFRPLVNGKPTAPPMARGDAITIRRVSKKAAGRQLDGRTWDQYPTTRTAVA